MNEQKTKNTFRRNTIWLLWLLFLITAVAMGQNSYTLNGTISDKSNGETLYGATVFLKGTTIGGVTNEYGFYSITAPAGDYVLNISYIGFQEINVEITLDRDQKVDFEVSEISTRLEEVVVTADEPERALLRKPEMSVAKMNIATVKQMPVVLGELDILKSLQMLPGVTSNGEGSGGFHVRGGASDQNLVLLDEAIIYNTSHMLGFFSVFPDHRGNIL